MEAIGRCLQEQRDHLATLAAGHEDARGLRQAIDDWVLEEVLLRETDGTQDI